VPNITPLRHTIGSYLGYVLTPEIAVEIELSAAVLPDLSHDPAKFGWVETGDFTIQVERLRDILPEIHVLHLEHWQETEGYRHAIALNLDYDAMLADERAGRLVQTTVRRNGVLCGNLRTYVFKSRHTQTLIAREDTFYLTPSARGGATASKLVKFHEEAMKLLGVREVEIDVKLVNRTDILMQRLGYTPVSTKLSKVFEEIGNV
jgi:hypothetical protein